MTTTTNQTPKARLDLARVRGVLCDMDGVLWRGTEILRGTPAFFQFLHERQIPYAMVTNNSTKSVSDYVERLTALGVAITPDRVITSVVVTLAHLQAHYPTGTPVYAVGSDRLREGLIAAGYVLDAATAQVVITGLDTQLTYDKLKIAGQLILAGATFISTNADRALPVADGMAPGAGTIIAALQTMTQQRPLVLGKPQPTMFRVALERLGVEPADALMIGDRLDTDIQGAGELGIPTALVLTGVTEAGSDHDASEIAPTGVFDDLAALLAAWQGG